MRFSLILISRNRPAYVDRLLRFYASQSLKSPIFIGDASSASDRERIKLLVDVLGANLDLRLTIYPEGAPLLARLADQFSKVETPYCAWVGDDDFLLPDALDAGAKHLDADPSCAAVVGESVLFALNTSQPFGNVTSLSSYPQSEYSQPSASRRLLVYAQAPVSLMYALRRTNLVVRQLRELASKDFSDDSFGYYFVEGMDSMLTVLAGKIHRLDQLAMVRQAHASSTGSRSGEFLRPIVDARWPALFDTMSRILALRIAGTEPTLAEKEIFRISELAIWFYISSTLRKRAANLYAQQRLQGTLVRLGYRARLLRALPVLRSYAVFAKMRLSLGTRNFRLLQQTLRHIEPGASGVSLSQQPP